MLPSHVRKFGMLDAMIGIGALAVVMTICRLSWQGRQKPLDVFAISLPFWTKNPIDRIQYVLRLTELLLMVVAVAFLMMRWRQPRPRFRRLIRQPGLAAALVVVLKSLLEMGLAVTAYRMTRVSADSMAIRQYAGPILLSNGLVVACLWFYLALSRTGRPERGWIDRLGRGVGGLWILIFLTHAIVQGVETTRDWSWAMRWILSH